MSTWAPQVGMGRLLKNRFLKDALKLGGGREAGWIQEELGEGGTGEYDENTLHEILRVNYMNTIL